MPDQARECQGAFGIAHFEGDGIANSKSVVVGCHAFDPDVVLPARPQSRTELDQLVDLVLVVIAHLDDALAPGILRAQLIKHAQAVVRIHVFHAGHGAEIQQGIARHRT